MKRKRPIKIPGATQSSQRYMRSTRTTYLNKVMAGDGNKNLWRYVKNQKKSSSGRNTLSQWKDWNKSKEKAEMLNNQFTSVFTKDQAETLPDLGNSTYPPMPKIAVDETGVCSLLARLDPKKASGADNIPAIILKNCAEEITPMLSTIIQKSYDTHVVPSDWRKAAVVSSPALETFKRYLLVPIY